MPTTNDPTTKIKRMSPVQVFRRLPPTLEILTECPHAVYEGLARASDEAFQKGFNVDQICNAVCTEATHHGYHAVVHPTEVVHRKFPSFPGQTVMGCYILVDLQEVSGPDLLA